MQRFKTKVGDRLVPANVAPWDEVRDELNSMLLGCRFVTRAKKNYHLDAVKKRIDPTPEIFADDLVRLEGKRFIKFPHLLRRIVFYCEETQKELVFLTNDMDSKAIVVAALYKQRWQIELFFKWIKQNLELKRFLANNPNAVRLQISPHLSSSWPSDCSSKPAA